MIQLKRLNNHRGVTLIELMVSVVIMAIVFTAIYAVQQGMERSANVQEQYVDIEQNLRIGMDSIARDIRIAGYLVPGGASPIRDAEPNTITMRAMSAPGFSARITADTTLANNPGSPQTLPIETPHPFDPGDYIRIVRPRDLGMPIERILTVSATTASSVDVLEVNEIVDFLTGDMLTIFVDPNTDADDDPNTFSGTATVTDVATISYAVAGNTLTRTAATAQVVADNITGLDLLYFLDDGTSSSDPTASQLDNIIGVQVTLSGQAATVDGVKNRTLISSNQLRNL